MSEDKSTIAQIREGKKEVKRWRNAEQRGVDYEYGILGEVWNQYGSLVDEHDETFAEVFSSLGIGSFREMLTERKNRGLSTNILDLMGGDASFLRDLKSPINRQTPVSPLDAGLCVTLVDGRADYLREMDEKLNIDVLSGDITSKAVWGDIEKWRAQKRIEGFDIVVLRGGDGVDTVPDVLYPFLFGKVWQNLSRKDGLFAAQLKTTDDLGKIGERLKGIPGIRTYLRPRSAINSREHYPVVGVIKTEKALEVFV